MPTKTKKPKAAVLETKGRRKVATVHFSVDPAWCTDFVRVRWAEGEYIWCLHFMEACGIEATADAHDVIRGSKKIVATEVPDEFTLAKDNWKPDLSRCHLGLYPDPKNLHEMNAARDVLAQDVAEKFLGVYLSEGIKDPHESELVVEAKARAIRRHGVNPDELEKVIERQRKLFLGEDVSEKPATIAQDECSEGGAYPDTPEITADQWNQENAMKLVNAMLYGMQRARSVSMENETMGVSIDVMPELFGPQGEQIMNMLVRISDAGRVRGMDLYNLMSYLVMHENARMQISIMSGIDYPLPDPKWMVALDE